MRDGTVATLSPEREEASHHPTPQPPSDAPHERHPHPCQRAYTRLRTRILATLTQPRRLLARGIQSIARTIFLILDIPARWLMDIGDTVVGNRGHVAVGSVLAAYFVVFGLIDAKSTQEETRAALERSLFMTLVSSGNTASFVAAMKNFGPTQMMPATEHPSWFRFWEWGRTYQPNRHPMWEWAVWRLPLCDAKAKDCSTDGNARIDLRFADLDDADLTGAELYLRRPARRLPAGRSPDARRPARRLPAGRLLVRRLLDRRRLDHAHLMRASLIGAWLFDANMNHADLRSADLERAVLSRAYLGDADLSGAKLDGQAQLGQACGTPANLPEGFHLSKPCPQP